MKSTVVACTGCTPYTAPAYGQTCVRTLPYAYAVVNSTTRNWAHLTSKHPQSPQKMGDGDYGRIPKGFCPLFDFGEEGRPSHDFSYFFHIFFTIGFLVSNCSKFCVKQMGSTVHEILIEFRQVASRQSSRCACVCQLPLLRLIDIGFNRDQRQ